MERRQLAERSTSAGWGKSAIRRWIGRHSSPSDKHYRLYVPERRWMQTYGMSLHNHFYGHGLPQTGPKSCAVRWRGTSAFLAKGALWV